MGQDQSSQSSRVLRSRVSVTCYLLCRRLSGWCSLNLTLVSSAVGTHFGVWCIIMMMKLTCWLAHVHNHTPTSRLEALWSTGLNRGHVLKRPLHKSYFPLAGRLREVRGWWMDQTCLLFSLLSRNSTTVQWHWYHVLRLWGLTVKCVFYHIFFGEKSKAYPQQTSGFNLDFHFMHLETFK